MSRNVMADITDYIDFLRSCNYSVTLSCFDKVFSPYLTTLYAYEIHLPSVCSYLKRKCDKCIKNKSNLQRSKPDKPYYSCCYAGIEEFVIPIKIESHTVVCINISGYKGKLPQSEYLRKRLIKKYGEEISVLYDDLNENVPDMNTVLSMIKPLEYMFCELYKACLKNTDISDVTERIYRRILQFIYDNYMSPVTVTEIANTLCYSESYIRHIFKARCGITIGQMINDIRLDQGAMLLRTTSLSITRISQDLGFCDGNYFSSTFTKKFGISPREYRKQNTEVR
ncbi:MAG: AraC family transcriptional regulator [Clostridia bacterium]|nr:AraC family transcriptional regulator [Clostridia bacterium]MEE1024147.1 AraC family transcriptional regulator [Acutalibacteraceae bacterium]